MSIGPSAADLFTPDQLEAHAARIAATHTLAPDPRSGRPLLPRLDDSSNRLDHAYRFLSAGARTDAQTVGSEDWLRDNHHVVQDQVRDVRQHLPRRYYLELPKLGDGPLQGFPRIYLLASELIAHTAGRIDVDTVADFTRAYQSGSELSIGEIWAVPIMLRLALVEELDRLAQDVVAARSNREKVRRWHLKRDADNGLGEREVRRILDEGRGADGRLSPAFVVELLQWLRDQPHTAAPAWQALQRALEAQDDSSEEMLRLEHQREAAVQLAIGNVITSMRLLSSIDWTLFFERVSLVEQTLRQDPAGAYGHMDFPTRDRYRHAVEGLAKRAKRKETDVARAAVDMAAAAQRDDQSHDRRHHVGYYLISRGRFLLEPAIRYSPTAGERFARFAFKHPAIGYLSINAALTLMGVWSFSEYGRRHGAQSWELWLVAVIVLLPISELVISLVNLIVTSRLPPRALPKLALLDGIPATCKTMVAVPAIIDSRARIDLLIDDLEVRFLGNRDPHLYFALLSDFADAAESTRETDAWLLDHARAGVDALNQRYGPGRFFFLHRERRWNAREGRWMGWERKRGKLTEFNRLLRGATDTTFTVVLGDHAVLQQIQFVITLDSDTQLPMETGRRLVGTLLHPLNMPRFDPVTGRVTEGYGVLQPRVGVNLVSANQSAFAKVYSGHVGIDIYTTAVSDVYQDLFHEGSYVGKGIYHVDAFEAALHDRVPENALLSHDLFEGSYARAGLVTDIHVVDDYPAHYLTFAGRQHRWARGDWQIARWLLPRVPDASRRTVRNTMPLIARWKILDNLRRSLTAPGLLALFLAGWTILPGSALLWTVLGVLVLAFPAYAQIARSLASRVRGVPISQHIAAEHEHVVMSARQSLLSAVFLAHQAWLMIDAIVRTSFRLLVSHRHLLEWMSADRLAGVTRTPSNVMRSMVAAPVIAFASALLIATVAPANLVLALSMIVLWLVSPLIAYATGQSLVHQRQSISDDDRTALRRIARKTWRYFEELVTPADHWLVPDNYQEDRDDAVAHRTSPTNIGLQLLSTLAAYDLGYISAAAVVERLEPTFATLLQMQRHRGHFYNWYDTRTLAPLAPLYVSSVDSGNLAGYLLTLKNGLTELAESDPVIDRRALSGIDDAIGLFEECLPASMRGAAATAVRTLKRELVQLRATLGEFPATPDAWPALLNRRDDQLASVGVLLHELEDASPDDTAATLVEAAFWLDRASVALAERRVDVNRSDADLSEMKDRAVRLAGLADDLIEEMQFGFLFDRQRQLFSIGYNVSDGRMDGSYYDALASEARLASFVAIATGQIPHEHWFKLGRSLTPAGTARALLSWSASMFEYFMPLLVMRAYPGTLLDETYRAVLERQIQYGVQKKVPWGISESAYNAQDLERNYQYRAFGVPGLGLKRGLADDLVVAPYASALAAPLLPADVSLNFERLGRIGMAGRYGLYESIDFTPERMPDEATTAVVLRTFMAHHQGMTLVSIDNALHDYPMQRHFHADPRVQAADLLLQERIPHQVPLNNPPIELADHVPSVREATSATVRRYTTPHTLSPRPHLLSNGSYVVMITNAGGGYSRRQQTAMTRWREDVTTDAWGSFCYVRDLDSGHLWSTTHQPTSREPDEYEAMFAPDRALFRRLDGEIESRTELVVSPEDDAELRRVSITNHGSKPRKLDLTSYAEVVLAPGDADLSHPAFSNLFVETISVPERDALICVRRPRSGNDKRYLVHVLSGRGRGGPAPQFETDRARFLGRGGTIDRPLAITTGSPLSNTTGAVLDPIVSLRTPLRLAAGATARLTFTTGYAESEEAARQLIEKYQDRRAVARAIALASTHSQIELRHLGLTGEDTIAFQRLGGRLISGDARLRDPDAIVENRAGQRELWKYGISGDLPLLLVRVTESAGVPLLADLLKAHEYLRGKGLPFDLFIVNEHPASYLQPLQEELLRLIEGGPEQAWIDKPGGVFLRRGDLMPPADILLLRAAARVVMDAADGGLGNQLSRPHAVFDAGQTRSRISDPDAEVASAPAATPATRPQLEMFNGRGGFAPDGREYVIATDGAAGGKPPVPWTNVVATEHFGFACTESGPGYTWSGNSHDNRLTPWNNDPVGDPPGEAIFIRNESSGAFWSATPLPAGGNHRYVTRHGQGYSVYEHTRDDVASILTLFVPRKDTVKLFRLSLKNTSGIARRLSVTFYLEWVLGENRSRTSMHVVTAIEPVTGAVVAVNRFRQEFPERVSFMDLSPSAARSVTGDRAEFIGRNGSLRRPAALGRDHLSNRVGAAYDPCGAIRIEIDLGPSEERSVVGLLGDAANIDDVRTLVERYRDQTVADAALEDARRYWDEMLSTLVVRTPDRAMDLVLNRWLPYQTLACRIWGRSAFYQSSGAFGFRDQLQDTLAFLSTAPAIPRAHLLHAASRQFVEGDVQHWWHEPGGQGVRTRFSDDRLWLPYAALQYVAATADHAILDETVPFLAGRLLEPHEHEAYEVPSVSAESASLYEHCVRAIEVSLGTGSHGLPLMGTGDWNDGMSLVGAGGKGESVWLGWFLVSILRPFADLVETRGDGPRAAKYRAHADQLNAAIEDAWDGEWYRRAYFDDGTPLGSKDNPECRIDAIAQSWSVISGAGEPARAKRAMAAVDQHLVRRDDGVVLLLTPPFDTMEPSPGYIRGYLPGVRENGGQYTHAALWNVMACAQLGDGDRASELFALLNPVNHGRTPEDVARYRAEPYVVAADVYSVPPHTGRGGWTWYTGSAGWMYRVGIESILGITLRYDALRIDPCIPQTWDGFEAVYKRGSTQYRIVVTNPRRVNRGVTRLTVDGNDITGRDIAIIDDGAAHAVAVVLG
ncbi:glucoamylase family protein [soil metagenome]